MGCGGVTISGASGLQGLARPEGVDAGRSNREAMPDLTAKRTLVKSPPELWSELSEVERLARHLGAFGEIKITKLEPEHTVAWEGEGASGTVSIEPSGWGTKVTLTAQLEWAAAQSPETAAGEVATAVSGESDRTTETVAERAVVEELVAEEPIAEGPLAEEPMGEEPASEEPAAEGPVSEGPVAGGSVAEGPVAEEPVVEERVVEQPPAAQPSPAEPSPPEPAAPVAAKPRHKRGFLAWLFRQRTSGREAAAPVPAPAVPVVGGPVEEKSPVAEAPQVAEEPWVGEESRVGEEPWVGERKPVAADDEPLVVETEPIAAHDEPVALQAESVATNGEPVDLEEESVAANDEPVAAQAEPVAADDEPVAAQAETVAEDEARLNPERAQAILDGALDALGSAHHRPFSRG